MLKLDCSKARSQLGWQPRWNLDAALKRIVHWHRSWLRGDDVRRACREEIAAFCATGL
jgi:CDP-glucose 4,6-dehydratase